MQSIPGFHFSYGSTARQKCRARRAQARHPRTFPSPLLPPPYHNAVGIRRAWHSPCEARPSAPTTHYPLPSFPSSLLLEAHCKVTTHYLLPSSPYSLPSQARPSAPSTHFSLLSSPYSLPSQARPSVPTTHYLLPSSPSPPTFTGALKRASHALPSPFFSLFSTLEAHCKVTTHFSLLSSPYSLPSQARSSAPATHYPLLSSPYSLL